MQQQRTLSAAPPPAAEVERLNVCQFVLYQHTVLSLCFRKAGKSKSAGINLEEFSARERIFIFVFVTSCTLAVAMTSAISDTSDRWCSCSAFRAVGRSVAAVTHSLTYLLTYVRTSYIVLVSS